MAAKVNKTVHISIKEGSAVNKPQFSTKGVLGGGTRINTPGKTRGQSNAPATGNGFGTSRGIQKGGNKGSGY